MSPENDLVYPADGMRRLLAMEKTNGIWTQKMMMRVERRMVNIMDHENREIVEQFPLGLVREPTAFTSNDPKEMYNNILIYIVGHPPGESPMPAEMHIFQCVNVRAREVVEDLKAFMRGKGPPPHHQHHGRHEIEVGDLSPYGDEGLEGHGGARMQAQLGGERNFDDASSTSSDKYERDVGILNRCFDDIEKFIARLQNAAAAFRELEKRRRSRKSKRKDLGDGMLSMRAKPPPEREFVDIFQKFKLSFNLLAKLKAHIHDPNAPELVHFLFTPLALIVDASHDSHYGPNLPAKVVAPLLTGNAVELLINCLTSKESELWHSLGEAWYVPREEWKGFVSPYRPVFMDGYSPSYVEGGNGDEYGDAGEESDIERRHMHHQRRGSDVSADSADRNGRGHHHHHDQVDGARGGGGMMLSNAPPPMMMNRFEADQRAYLADLLQSGCRVVQVTYPRTANNEKELTVVRGEFLELLDSTRKWWKARNIGGQVGHVPHTIVTEGFDRSQAAGAARPSSAAGSRRYY